MVQKYFIVVLLGLFLAGGAVFAGTMAEVQEQAIAEQLAKMESEPPLTQADIDTFLELAEKAAEIASDPNAMFKLYEDNGISPQRLGVIGPKMTIGLLMSQGITMEQITGSGQFLDFMIPSEAELAIINKNMDALLKAMGQ